jgi:plasmid segregation protein ParM
MFESIIARAQSSVGITLNERAIEDILKNRKHFFKPDVVAAVKQYTATYAKQIVDRCVQAGCDVSMYPVVYVGGGCLLLKDELLKNPNVCYAEFVEDTRANASSYEAFMKKKYNMN